MSLRPTSASGGSQRPDDYSVLITESAYYENDVEPVVTSRNLSSAPSERSRRPRGEKAARSPSRSPSRKDMEEMEEDCAKEKSTMANKLSLKKPKLTRTAQKDVVIDAVYSMEKENEQLRMATNRLMDDMDRMRKENEKLKREVESLKNVKESWATRIEKLENDNRRLHREVEIRVTKFKQESEKRESEFQELSKENDNNVHLIKNLQHDLAQRGRDLLRRTQEVEKLKEKLDLAYRRNFDDHRLELLHEVEQLKTQKRDMYIEREQLEREHQKLQEEYKLLEGKLSDQEAELKNENRRHSLLTKEFNSLLDENNRLKIQLRRRTSLNIQICPASKESLNEKVTDVSPGRGNRKYGSDMRRSIAMYTTDGRSPTPGDSFPNLGRARNKRR